MQAGVSGPWQDSIPRGRNTIYQHCDQECLDPMKYIFHPSPWLESLSIQIIHIIFLINIQRLPKLQSTRPQQSCLKLFFWTKTEIQHELAQPDRPISKLEFSHLMLYSNKAMNQKTLYLLFFQLRQNSTLKQNAFYGHHSSSCNSLSSARSCYSN